MTKEKTTKAKPKTKPKAEKPVASAKRCNFAGNRGNTPMGR